MAIYQSACTYACKHVELVAHQVENRLNSVLTTQIRLPKTHTVANPDSVKNEAGLRHQSVNPEDRHCNSASAKGMVAHEVCPKPSQKCQLLAKQRAVTWANKTFPQHLLTLPTCTSHSMRCLVHFALSPKNLVRQLCSLEG